jgi:undecaprenyl-diphosphatase
MVVSAQGRWALLISAVAATAFCVLAWLVATGETLPFDTAVRAALHASAAPYLTWAATIVSTLGRIVVLVPATAAAAAYLMVKGRRSESFAYLLTMGGALALNWTLKALIQRSRPDPFYGVDPDSYSFPSGHVLLAVCFCSALTLTLCRGSKLAMAACAVFVLFIAWSRVYLGVHYPTDVTAGGLAAVCWIAALYSSGLFTIARGASG